VKCLTGKTSGTCVPECPWYGTCHCGCGRETRPYAAHTKQRFTHGLCCINANGHRISQSSPGHWGTHGVDVDRIRPLLAWLREELGTYAAVGTVTSIPAASVSSIMNKPVKRVSPRTASKVVAGVLALRNRKHPDAPHVRRLPTPYERGLTEEPRTARNRQEKRLERARKRLEEAS